MRERFRGLKMKFLMRETCKNMCLMFRLDIKSIENEFNNIPIIIDKLKCLIFRLNENECHQKKTTLEIFKIYLIW